MRSQLAPMSVMRVSESHAAGNVQMLGGSRSCDAELCFTLSKKARTHSRYVLLLLL